MLIIHDGYRRDETVLLSDKESITFMEYFVFCLVYDSTTFRVWETDLLYIEVLNKTFLMNFYFLVMCVFIKDFKNLIIVCILLLTFKVVIPLLIKISHSI